MIGLILACFAAGAVDAIGGGGGLITVPALLNARVPNFFLLGTNKSIAASGVSVSVFQYARAGLLPKLSGKSWLLLILSAVFGGITGATLSRLALILGHIDIIIPVVLVGVMSFLVHRWFIKKPIPGRFVAEPKSPNPKDTAPMLALVAGYDGLFGPGAGTLYLSFFEKRGFPTVEANAITKIFNLSSNLGALLVFASQGAVLWSTGLSCAGAIMLGNWVGSSLVLKRGQGLVRITVLLTTSAMLVRYFILRFS